MAYQNDRGGFGGGGNRGGNRFGGGGYRGGQHGGGGYGGRKSMEMHQATCSDCGKACEVPFRPSGSKPVFCSNCFKGKKGESTGGERNSDRRDYGDRDRAERPQAEMFQAVCSDCGKDCEVPFRPSSEKPVYCEKCFGRNKEVKSTKPGHGSDKSDTRLDMINIKLDRILKLLGEKTLAGDGKKDSKSKENAPGYGELDEKPTSKSPVIKGIKVVKPKGSKRSNKKSKK